MRTVSEVQPAAPPAQAANRHLGTNKPHFGTNTMHSGTHKINFGTSPVTKVGRLAICETSTSSNIATNFPASQDALSVLSTTSDEVSSSESTLQQFEEVLQLALGSPSSKIPLGAIYPEFASCDSMSAVIQLSSELAPCSFDIVKARAAHKMDPKSLNSGILQNDLLYAQTYGLRKLLTTRFHEAENITLQPAIVSSDFKSVITFKNLHAVAYVCTYHTVLTSVVSSDVQSLNISLSR
jgi:hypothetical protein